MKFQSIFLVLVVASLSLTGATAVASTAANTTPNIETNTEANPVDASFDGGYLVFKSQDGNYQMRIDGRVMLDTGTIDTDKNTDAVANTEFRRARLGFKTLYDKTWAGEWDIGVAENEIEMRDMWVAYMAIPNTMIKIGHHKPFYSMAEVTTSRWYTFMETPMVTDATGPGRRIGISASYYQNNYFVGVSLFGDEVGIENTDPEGDGSEPGKNEPYSYSTRLVYRPMVSEDVSQFVHVGVNYMKLQPQSDDGGKMRLRNRLESRVFDYKYLSTGKVSDVDYQVSQGLEVVGRFDKIMFQSEYIETEFVKESGATDGDASFSGYYVETAYALVGNGRPYNVMDGEFGSVMPSGAHGDMEVAFRYSSLDLNDAGAGVTGGQSDNITLAFNWYAHSNIIFRFNHTIADMDENADGDGDFVGGDKVSITGMRIVYLF